MNAPIIIQARRWQHPDGRTASIYGALPYGEGWRVINCGWTIRFPDGRVGIGRVPFQTRDEAEQWIRDYHARRAAP